jgi:hypothetical protein
MITLTRLSSVTAMILLLAGQHLSAQTTGQYNVNDTRRWFDGTAWLQNNGINGVGSTALINQDLTSFRHVADMVETVATVAGAFPQTTTKVLAGIPVDGTLAVSDPTFGHSWSQRRGSTNQSAFNVTYNQGTNTVTIIATPPPSTSAPASPRTINIAYATTSNTPFSDRPASASGPDQCFDADIHRDAGAEPNYHRHGFD